VSSARSLPRTAIVLPNYNGKRHLDPCIHSLQEMGIPEDRLEILVVDNGSVDGSVEHLRRRHPRVRVHENGANLGFSAACNQGARLAGDVEILVFLNNDMRVAPGFLAELLQPIQEKRAHCTAAKILSWDGHRLNYAGSGMNFHGIGYQKGYNEAPAPEHDVEGPTLFACGGAMAIERTVFESVLGFDEDYFAYYEDADLGWRLWVLGYDVLYAPRSVVYHHHSVTSRSFPNELIRLLQIRNPLLTIFKNYERAHLDGILSASVLLAVRRALIVGGIDVDRFRIEKSRSRPIGGLREVLVKAQRRLGRKLSVSKLALADLVALGDLGDLLPRFVEKRAWIQERRKRPDAEILPMFEEPFWCVEPRESYKVLLQTVREFFELDKVFHGVERSRRSRPR